MNEQLRNSDWENDVAAKNRFRFGQNWQSFIRNLSAEQVLAAQESLKRLFEEEDLSGKSFVDVGCGSGLFSLAARNLGATVVSFDFDEDAVDCTKGLKSQYFPEDRSWTVMQGSALDLEFLRSLGGFDIVYSWGVLHHTGNLARALDNLFHLSKPGSLVCVALYNHQTYASRYWSMVKRNYVRFPLIRPFLVLVHFIYPGIPSALLRFAQKRSRERGMSFFSDLKDWLGGWPFETISPEETVQQFARAGFDLASFKGVGKRSGCNEYVFVRP